MVSKRKVFDCGHTGFGKFCHLCKQLKSGELIEDGVGKYKLNPAHVTDSMKREQRLNRALREVL